MGAAKAIRKIMVDKEVSVKQLAEQMGKPYQTVLNTFIKDSMSIRMAMLYANELDCDIVFKDRKTGEEYTIVQ